MFVLGFQEIVPLTAQQIVQTDPEKRFIILRAVRQALTHSPQGGYGKIEY
jgi:hypothetical protein